MNLWIGAFSVVAGVCTAFSFYYAGVLAERQRWQLRLRIWMASERFGE